MTEPERPDPLAALGERIEKARRAQAGKQRSREAEAGPSSKAGMGLGFRIGLELVVAVAVGVGLGWAFDRWLGTRPWGLLVFVFLGIGAGMSNVYRVVKGLGMGVGYKGGGEAKNDWDED
ncbi:MAG TPA: AtpZ/AtpI family protein [Stellaceae bacterium]|nr:AtpZ/AtpI family protein [Stellaceae bacterium]